MENTKRILSYTRRAVDDYKMIEDGDKIAVGISGGKDSIALLCSLAQLRRFYPRKFELIAITIDMGFEGEMDFSRVKELCAELDVPYHIIKTDIYDIIFNVRKEANPCALCAKMRRGALHNAAKDLGCNTVALGHHFDDVVETFMLNLFFEGRIGCFQPVTHLSRVGIKLIRPLIYMPERHVVDFVNKNSLPVVTSECPEDKHTEREEMKTLLHQLEHKYKGLRYRLYGAICRGEVDGFKEIGRMQGMREYAIPDDGENVCDDDKPEGISDTDAQN